MSSTTANKKKKRTIRFWAVAVWLFVWQAVSVWIGQEILLVSPVVVLERLTGLVMETEFWRSIGFSLVRILGGFFLAAAAGILAAGLSAKFERIREFFAPAVMVVKAVPVASFIILVLIWVPSRNLSVVISFLMVFPILYTNVLDGILSTDPKLLEMADVFALPTQCGSVTFMFPKYCRFSEPGVPSALDSVGKPGWRQRSSGFQTVPSGKSFTMPRYISIRRICLHGRW